MTTEQFKTFAENTIGYAADVNDYLMRQVNVWTANSSDRDAIPSPTSGLRVWRDDLKAFQTYDGTTWNTEPLRGTLDTVATSETTTSTSSTDLTTVGPTVTVTVPASGNVLIQMDTFIANSVAGNKSGLNMDVSGANTIAPSTSIPAYSRWTASDNSFEFLTRQFVWTGLTAGSTTFKLKYFVSAGTGTYKFRSLTVTPLP